MFGAPRGPLSKEYLKRLSKGEAEVTPQALAADGVDSPNASAIKQIAYAVRHGVGLKTLNLDNFRLMEDATDAVASIISNNPTIEYINFDHNILHRKADSTLGDAIGRCKNLHTLKLDMISMPDEFLHFLCKSLRGHEKLEHFATSALIIRQTACSSLGNFIGSLPNLQSCSIRAGAILQPEALAYGIAENHSLFQVELSSRNIDRTRWDRLDEIIAEKDSPNLAILRPVGRHCAPMLLRNMEALSALSEQFKEYTNLADCPPHLLQTVGNRHYALSQLTESSPLLKDVKPYLANMPQHVPLIADKMLEQNDHGFCAMDNPKILRNFSAIQEKMQRLGGGFTREQLLAPTRRGTPLFLDIAGCEALESSLPALNAKGITLDSHTLLNKNGEAGAYLQHFIKRGDAAQLFNENNCRNMKPAELRKLHNSLPKETQADIRNYQQLLVRLDQRAPKRGR